MVLRAGWRRPDFIVEALPFLPAGKFVHPPVLGGACWQLCWLRPCPHCLACPLKHNGARTTELKHLAQGDLWAMQVILPLLLPPRERQIWACASLALPASSVASALPRREEFDFAFNLPLTLRMGECQDVGADTPLSHSLILQLLCCCGQMTQPVRLDQQQPQLATELFASCTSTCVPVAGLPCPATPCSQMWLERLASDRLLALAPLTLPLEAMAQGGACRAAVFRCLELSFDSSGFRSRRLVQLPSLLPAPTGGPPCIMFTHCLHAARSALSKASTWH